MVTFLKWAALVLAILIAGLFTYRALTVDDTNARVAELIRSQPDGERAQRTMLIWLQDGRMYPVNYLEEDGFVYMGIDGLWWREFTGDGQPVEMLIRGNRSTGHARAILDDPERTADVFSRLRPTAPPWLPAWLNGKLVEISVN